MNTTKYFVTDQNSCCIFKVCDTYELAKKYVDELDGDYLIEPVLLKYFGKVILISIRPEWVYKILKGEKTLEIRKLFPKDYVGWVFIYCTKGKTELYYTDKGYVLTDLGIGSYYKNTKLLNGLVVAKFWCDKVEEIKIDKGVMWRFGGHMYITDSVYDATKLLRYSCLEQYQLENYLQGKTGYAIHISKLEVFDRPRELCEFHTNIKKEPPEELLCPECGKPMEYYEYKYLTKAPQSWQFIEDERVEHYEGL